MEFSNLSSRFLQNFNSYHMSNNTWGNNENFEKSGKAPRFMGSDPSRKWTKNRILQRPLLYHF